MGACGSMPSAVLIDIWNKITAPEPKQNPFQRLVKDLSDVLGPSSGLDSADVDVESIIKLMKEYISDQPQWIKYAFEDPNKIFTRNLVDKGNGKSNLLLLVWTPGKETPIHSHANSHCVMKILRGSLVETTYDWPEEANKVKGANLGLKKQREKKYTKDQVAYIEDSIGLHKIVTPANEFAVSLHLYTPPNAAREGFLTFDEKTGAQTYIHEYKYHSEMGQPAVQ